MSPQDQLAFATAFRALAASYRGKVPTEPEVDAYWLGLRDRPWPWVHAAMAAAPRRCPRFMPTLGELLEAGAAAELEAGRRLAIVPAMTSAIVEGEAYCGDCADTGWISHERPCAGASRAYHADATRRYARACPCRRQNPIYRAKLDRTPRLTREAS